MTTYIESLEGFMGHWKRFKDLDEALKHELLSVMATHRFRVSSLNSGKNGGSIKSSPGSFSLFGDLESFCEVVRGIVPWTVGDPVFLDVDTDSGQGRISFEFDTNGAHWWLTFAGDAYGNGLVTLANGSASFFRFDSFAYLRNKFPSWFYETLDGGYG